MRSRFTFAAKSIIGLGLAGLALLGPVAPASAAGLPFTDQNATSSIGLCDAEGNPITSGSIDSHAFVTAAAASSPAPYPDRKSKATLFAFQPRQGVDPGEWSGYQMTAGSVFSDPQHPVVSGTNLDPSLRDFMANYALKWDGLLELRIYYTAENTVVSRRSYPAAVLKVTGNTWTMVQGASNITCKLSTAVSSEKLNLPASDFDPNHPAVTHAPAPVGASSGAGSTSSAAGGGSASPIPSVPSNDSTAAQSGPASVAAADTTSKSGHSSTAGYWVIGGLVVLLVAGLVIVRRVRAAQH